MADYDIIISIVTYQNDESILKRTIESVLDTVLKVKLYVIDNSPTDETRSFCDTPQIEYIFSNSNIGFGAAHNIAIARTIASHAPYHLVANPDIYFENGTLEKIFSFMDDNQDVGLLMPKVLYPDGSIQYLCKLLPTPTQLILRRFLSFKRILDKRNELYELRFTGYDKTMAVPYLSGCFMFLRTKILERVGLFDERFFMYFEDLDLSRRINSCSRTIYYPEVAIYHSYQKGSYKHAKLLMHHLASAIRYFNKWGYVFDKSRCEINAKTLRELV